MRQPITAVALIASLLICLIVVPTRGAAADSIEITDAWARATPPGVAVGAAYFVIRNFGQDDRLIEVSTPAAERAELHITKERNGVVRMQHMDTVEIKGDASTAFAPGGRHVMLLGLSKALREGDVIPLVLRFEKAGVRETRVRVRSFTAPPNSRRTPLRKRALS